MLADGMAAAVARALDSRPWRGRAGRSLAFNRQAAKAKHPALSRARAATSQNHWPEVWVQSASALTAVTWPALMPRTPTEEAAAASPHRSGSSPAMTDVTEFVDRSEVTPLSAICAIEVAVMIATACSSLRARVDTNRPRLIAATLSAARPRKRSTSGLISSDRCGALFGTEQNTTVIRPAWATAITAYTIHFAISTRTAPTPARYSRRMTSSSLTTSL